MRHPDDTNLPWRGVHRSTRLLDCLGHDDASGSQPETWLGWSTNRSSSHFATAKMHHPVSRCQIEVFLASRVLSTTDCIFCWYLQISVHRGYPESLNLGGHRSCETIVVKRTRQRNTGCQCQLRRMVVQPTSGQTCLMTWIRFSSLLWAHETHQEPSRDHYLEHLPILAVRCWQKTSTRVRNQKLELWVMLHPISREMGHESRTVRKQHSDWSKKQTNLCLMSNWMMHTSPYIPAPNSWSGMISQWLVTRMRLKVTELMEVPLVVTCWRMSLSDWATNKLKSVLRSSLSAEIPQAFATLMMSCLQLVYSGVISTDIKWRSKTSPMPWKQHLESLFSTRSECTMQCRTANRQLQAWLKNEAEPSCWDSKTVSKSTTRIFDGVTATFSWLMVWWRRRCRVESCLSRTPRWKIGPGHDVYVVKEPREKWEWTRWMTYRHLGPQNPGRAGKYPNKKCDVPKPEVPASNQSCEGDVET